MHIAVMNAPLPVPLRFTPQFLPLPAILHAPKSVTDLPKVDRDLLLLQFWLTEGESFQKAARRAGFAKGISKYHKLRSKAFQAKLEQFAPAYWVASNQALALRAIPGLEKAVEHFNKHPKVLIEKPTLLDKVAKAAGFAPDFGTPGTQVINIKEIQAIVFKNLSTRSGDE